MGRQLGRAGTQAFISKVRTCQRRLSIRCSVDSSRPQTERYRAITPRPELMYLVWVSHTETGRHCAIAFVFVSEML